MVGKLKRDLMRFVKLSSRKLCLVFDESDEITNPSSQRTKHILAVFRRLKYKILDTGTTTRNNIAELYSQFELLYNNSVNMTCWCDSIYHENRDKEIECERNLHCGEPFPAFRGHVLFLLSLEAMNVTAKNGKETWVSEGRTYLIDNEPQDIVARFNTEKRGLYNYYSIANNASAIGSSFGCIMKFSMYKTLAQKFNCSVRTITNNYRKDNLFAVPFIDKKGETKYRVFYNEGFQRKTDLPTDKADNLPYLFKSPSLSLIERLVSRKCKLCGKNGNVSYIMSER